MEILELYHHPEIDRFLLFSNMLLATKHSALFPYKKQLIVSAGNASRLVVTRWLTSQVPAPGSFITTPQLPATVHIIDTNYANRPNFAATYLIQQKGKAAFVDNNTVHAVPRFMRALEHFQIKPTDVGTYICSKMKRVM